MTTVSFPGVSGHFSVTMDGAAENIDRHTLWIDTVGRHLHGCGEGALHAAYQAAGFNTLSASALRLRVKRRSVRHRQCAVHFSPTMPSSTAADRHVVRSQARRLKGAIEEHYDAIFVLVGALQSSLGSFVKLNKLLAFEPASSRDACGRKRRKKLSFMGSSFPCFRSIKSYTRKLVEWASTRIPMGELVLTPTLLADTLVQVYCFFVR